MSDTNKLPTLANLKQLHQSILSCLDKLAHDIKALEARAEAKAPPAPHPWLIALAKLIESEKTVLPPCCEVIHWYGGWHFSPGGGAIAGNVWDAIRNGPLPPRDESTPTEVTIEEIRAAREWVKQQEGNRA